jgi:hypothetical protein
MELHTPHSTEKSAPLSVDWISRHSRYNSASNSKTNRRLSDDKLEKRDKDPVFAPQPGQPLKKAGLFQ